MTGKYVCPWQKSKPKFLDNLEVALVRPAYWQESKGIGKGWFVIKCVDGVFHSYTGVEYETFEEAMTAIDEFIAKHGWTILTDDQWEKIQALL